MRRPTRPKQRIRQAACALCACAGLAASAATIGYVADGSAGPYCNRGYGIEVNVSTPATGCMVEYAESAEGPWSTEPVTYTDVCTDRPVWFRLSAAGYDTVVDRALVTITPKELTDEHVWVEQDEEYVYDGTEKHPTPRFADPAALLTADDFDVIYRDNVNAGTARAVFTGRNNYAGTVEVEFEILKAENEWTTPPAVADWTYGQAASEPVSAAKSGTAVVTWSSGAKPTLPGSYTATFTVPESQNYNELTATVGFTVRAATIRYVADGNPPDSVYCSRGYGIEVNVSTPATGCTVEYAESAEGPWSTEPVTYTDVCTDRPVWFRLSATGYATVVDKALVTIAPKPLTEDYVWVEEPSGGYVYDGTPKTPAARFGDGDPSILTENDFDVAYRDNVNAGTACAVFTGRNNYAGTVEVEFEIRRRQVTLTSGDGSWTHDGAAHSETTVTVGGDGFAPGEGATYGNFATLADADSVPNTFDYTLDAGTLAGNYEITKAYGTLTVTPPPVTVYEESDAETIFRWEATGAATARILGFKDPNQKIANVVIPDKIEGRFITAIADGAFANSASGMAALTLPLFCTEIGFRAFSGISTLARVTFAPVRDWTDPAAPAGLAVGRYAFTSTGLTSVRLPAEVTSLGDYAFADCRKLTEVTVLGRPTVGKRPFRRAGIDAGTSPTVWLDRSLADDAGYLGALTQDVGDVKVRTDAVVDGLSLGGLEAAPGVVRLTVAVERASAWGAVDASRLRVECRARLGDAPAVLAPRAVTRGADGSLTLEVAAPEGSSGFFRVRLED